MTQQPLFSFGTLMDSDVLELVAGMPLNQLTIQKACLVGFSQRQVRKENYPVLIEDQPGLVNGLVIHGLNNLALQRILFFEGDEYKLADLIVKDNQGNSISAQYFRDTDVYEVLPTAWSFELWRKQHKAHFMRQVAGYMKLYGTMSATEADQYWEQLRHN